MNVLNKTMPRKVKAPKTKCGSCNKHYADDNSRTFTKCCLCEKKCCEKCLTHPIYLTRNTISCRKCHDPICKTCFQSEVHKYVDTLIEEHEDDEWCERRGHPDACAEDINCNSKSIITEFLNDVDYPSMTCAQCQYDD